MRTLPIFGSLSSARYDFFLDHRSVPPEVVKRTVAGRPLLDDLGADLISDLVSEGFVGLLNAARIFDPNMVGCHRNYATGHVQEAISEFLQEDSTVPSSMSYPNGYVSLGVGSLYSAGAIPAPLALGKMDGEHIRDPLEYRSTAPAHDEQADLKAKLMKLAFKNGRRDVVQFLNITVGREIDPELAIEAYCQGNMMLYRVHLFLRDRGFDAPMREDFFARFGDRIHSRTEYGELYGLMREFRSNRS